jgi:hypothetical protein
MVTPKLTKVTDATWDGYSTRTPAVWRVRGTEITCSTNCGAGWSARFPDGNFAVYPRGWTRAEMLAQIAKIMATWK